jgi:UDP:flavonoid glycosyltransferase YjiC (YdhE family)
MQALALLVRAAGHTPVLVAPPNFEGAALASGLSFRAVGQDMQALLATMAEAATGGPRKTFQGFNRVLLGELRRQFEGLPAAVDGADLLLAGGLPLAAPSVAERFAIPYRTVAYCPVLFRSGAHPPLMVPYQGLPAWCNRALWRVTDAFYQSFVGPTLNSLRGTLGLSPVTDLYHYLVGDGALLAADEPLAPLPTDVAVPVHRVGFLPLPEPDALEPALEDFLADGPEPVCITFGSMPDTDPAQTTRILLDALARTDTRAVLVGGWAGLGEGALPRTVQRVSSAPFGRLFPRVRAVVHHGGAGTTGTAARAGVPQVVVPHLMDQPWWALRLRALGVAPEPIARPRLDAPRLARALTQVLHQPSFAERARALAATPRPGNDLRVLLEDLRASVPAGRPRR